MSKTQSGLLLVGVGVALNILGRLVSPLAREQQSVGVAGALLILMLASVVVGLFGIVRLVTGVITKS